MENALVSMVNGTPTTSSQLVAETFGKRHCDVLRDIEKILPQLPESFSQRNFASANYLDAQGKNRIMYLLTRDAFTLLAMGYTGKEAMQFKVKYIEAFNAMEEELKKPRHKSRKALPKPEPRPMVDPFALEPISLRDLTEAIGGLTHRLELTCHSVTDEDWKAGAQRFYKAAGSNHNLTNMLSCTLVGPRFATLTLLRSACEMSHNALRMYELVCSCR